ncbi:uncharacterized protein PHALS_05831 [Plasmopara halstedii]|uniref:Secreted protein n=1 Tax=Plasmopara halstedii TaxID=4781 RepID=A0A0P1AA85_PLAHL|nr:uncharacterized protein PHALS_05831 [Plasmopara halstedii]CEG37775.1 hypothetical protein PHALS_05831 [Plasmopara halstedii]|eukprot:XP_024574144.1 hypothetical protein PHALS_05831 [Plasmopara halstedii]
MYLHLIVQACHHHLSVVALALAHVICLDYHPTSIAYNCCSLPSKEPELNAGLATYLYFLEYYVVALSSERRFKLTAMVEMLE